MKYRLLGTTGMRVSEIGFGAWAIGGPVDVFGLPVGWGVVHDEDSRAAIRRALEIGINFFDTANVYGNGHSEEILGECLAGTEALVATKVGIARTEKQSIKDFSDAPVREALEASLRRLRRDTIDLYQLHNPPPDVWKRDEIFRLLDQFKTEGKIRASGVSTSTAEEGIHLIENKKVDCLQILFNILQQEPALKVLPLAEKNRIGIVVRVPLASGLLTGKFNVGHEFARDDNRRNYLNAQRLGEALQKVERLKDITRDSKHSLSQSALAFLLKFSAISVAIPGAKNPSQVDQNASASDFILEDNVFEQIRKEFADYNFFQRYHVKV
jgi:aryl-alcohol dehydrogenase-like predicted oxidoreductase